MKSVAPPTLADLLADPARVADLAPAERDHLLRQVAGLVLVLAVAPSTASEPTNGDGKMLTPSEAAALANTTTSWIWRRARRADSRPWVARLGRRTMRIREREFQVWLATGGGAR
jgi:hypothetical protein